MIIDIKKTILRRNLANFIVLIILAVVMVGLLTIPFRRDIIKGIDNSLLAIFFAAAYVINAFYQSFRNYNYIYFSDESDKIVFRYFSPNIFTSKKNSIEIPKREFAGYVLDSFFMRYREKITLLRRTNKGVAKYPPVSITALSIDERHMLLFVLDQLRQKIEK